VVVGLGVPAGTGGCGAAAGARDVSIADRSPCDADALLPRPQHLRGEFCVETALFVLDVWRLRDPDEVADDDVPEAAARLWTVFVRPGAEQQVNLSSRSVRRVSDELKRLSGLGLRMPGAPGYVEPSAPVDTDVTGPADASEAPLTPSVGMADDDDAWDGLGAGGAGASARPQAQPIEGGGGGIHSVLGRALLERADQMSAVGHRRSSDLTAHMHAGSGSRSEQRSRRHVGGGGRGSGGGSLQMSHGSESRSVDGRGPDGGAWGTPVHGRPRADTGVERADSDLLRRARHAFDDAVRTTLVTLGHDAYARFRRTPEYVTAVVMLREGRGTDESDEVRSS